MSREYSIRERRNSLGWSQVKLGSEAGLLQAHVSQAERSRALPWVTQRLEDALLIEERRRIEMAQEEAGAANRRALAAAVPDSPEWRSLRTILAERAIDLLNVGKGDACDALLELIPHDEADRLLSEWLDGQFPQAADEGEPPR